LVTLFIFLTSFCAERKKSAYYRFIDHLDREKIVHSPFLECSGDIEAFQKKNPGLYEIAGKYPLLDSGSGENPFLIKKKLSIGPVMINAILSPPVSQFRFKIDIPENAVFESTYGIRRDRELEKKKKGRRTAQFSMVLEIDGKKTQIFAKTLRLNPERSLIFDFKNIDLSAYGNKTATVYLRTYGDEKALACWFNPLLYIPQRETRNVILFSLDTLRADHLGCYGYPHETSPNIDDLAEDSALFLKAFATSPWTLPSHVSLMTSLNCINHRVYADDQKIDPSLTTLAEFLREEAYTSSAVTGGGYVSGLYGFSKGFDSYHVRGDIHAPDAAEAASEAAVNFIKRNQDRNFFLFVHTYQIHNPYHSPSPYNEMFIREGAELKKADMKKLRFYHENRYKPVSGKLLENFIGLYDGGIRYTDEALIKPVLFSLKSLGLYDDTMIILTSDHGEEFYEHKAWVHKHSLYNETIQIPLIIKSFGSAHAGKKAAQIVSLVDVMPTVLEALDADRSGSYMDGRSLYGFLSAEKQDKENGIFISELDEALKVHIPKRVALNNGRYKLIINESFSAEDLAFFLFPPPGIPEIEIYDLRNDPQERTNLATKNPELARRLLDFWNEIYRQKIDAVSAQAEKDEALEEQLRALGYIK